MTRIALISILCFSFACSIAEGSYVIPDGSVKTAKLAANAVTAAKIANATITSTQIANATLTQALLASRATGTTVAAGGVAVSASCGNFSVTTAVGSGLAAVTNLSVTITTTGRPVFVGVIPDGSGNYSDVFVGGGVGSILYIGLLRDSTGIGQWEVNPEGTDAGDFAAIPFAGYVIDAPAAGTYTYAIKAAESIPGSSHCGIQYLKLVAYEL